MNQEENQLQDQVQPSNDIPEVSDTELPTIYELKFPGVKVNIKVTGVLPRTTGVGGNVNNKEYDNRRTPTKPPPSW